MSISEKEAVFTSFDTLNSSYLHESNSKTCFFRPTNEDEMIKIVNKPGTNKSPSHDGLKPDVVKGIVSDSNNIFLWHESEDVNKKKLISKISINSNFTFSSYA